MIEKLEKEYCLKLKDKELLTFIFSIEKGEDGETYNFFLKDINEKNQKLFPITSENLFLYKLYFSHLYSSFLSLGIIQ